MQNHVEAPPPNHAPASSVRSAVFYPLLACNARCPFCSTRVYTPEGVVATSDFLKGDTQRGIQAYTLSFEESRERYRGFRDQGIESVNLQGGEPTVYEPLIDLLAYGKELGFKEQIVVTNGRRLADREFAERLYGSAATAIALSIFGATAAMHDESMGVPNAFADMLAGVRNLVAIERERREGRQLTAQLILHARNFEALPEMIDLWYGEGLRYFCVRLLRETPNTVGAEDQWLFDLARLKEPLERALERTLTLPDLQLVFPELPYCLPDARYTGFVLRDLVANKRLRVEKRVESRHSLSLLTSMRRDTVQGACDACQLGDVCVRVEVAHAPRFTGTLTPIDIPARIAALLAAPDAESDRAIGDVLEATDALPGFGVTEEAIGALRARRIAFAEARDLPDLPLRIASSRGVVRQIERRRGQRAKDNVVTRFVPLSELGATTPFTGTGAAIVARLAALAPPEKQPHVAYLGRCEAFLVDPLFVLFSARMPARGRTIDAWIVLHDDRVVSAAAMQKLLDA